MAAGPVFFHADYEKALEVSKLQSLTTHQGEEAAECCRLMAHIIVTAIHKGKGDKSILENIEFTSPLKSVTCLAKSQQEDETPGKNWSLEDRNWNWKDPNFKYSPSRATQQPGYVGSYCMDALAMALHCIWTTDSLKEAMLKSANMCGDADSVTSVTGQLAGAIYGFSAFPKEWIEAVQQWDGNGEIVLKAYKLFHHKKV
jgi:ADP-ribosylglycohydrolase